MLRLLRALLLACAAALCLSELRAAEITVFIHDYYFDPTNVTIAPGDTVTWINKGFVPHDTTSANGAWASSLLFNDEESFSFTFTQAGQYPYVCLTHIADYPQQTGLVVVASANLPPSVHITSPSNGVAFTAPASFQITAEATDSDGSVTNVQFLVNGAPAGNSPGPTFSANVNGLAAGSYSLTAIASDNNGAMTTSDPVVVTVTNPPVKYLLAVAVLPPNSGSVAVNPPQPLDGFDSGTLVTLTASAAQGFAFNGWSGDATGAQNPLTITMNAAKSVTANFSSNTLPTHVLTLNVNPFGRGTIQASPAPNGSDGTYLEGTVVTLTPLPARFFAFTNWTGDVNSTSNSITVAMDSDKSVTANFLPVPPGFTLTVLANPAGAGLFRLPAPNAPNDTFIPGTEVTLEAYGLGSYAFTNWTGAVESTSNAITFVMDADKTVTANFVPIIPPTFTLTVSIDPGTNAGTVLVTPPSATGSYPLGTVVALAAQPKPGFRFVRWNGVLILPTDNPLLLSMTRDISVAAVFEAIPAVNFGALAGLYSGLLFDERETNYTTSGFITVRLSKTGAYRGAATIGGIREFIAGQFDRFGYAPLVVRRATLTGSIQIDEFGRMMGVITDGAPRNPKVPMFVLYRSARTNIQALAGSYSITIPPASPVEDEGSATLQVLPNGTARMHGVLGDGTVFTERTFVTADLRMSLFVRLYGGRGAILGWLDLSGAGSLHGTARWFRPGNSRNVNFPDGFSLLVPAIGSRSY